MITTQRGLFPRTMAATGSPDTSAPVRGNNGPENEDEYIKFRPGKVCERVFGVGNAVLRTPGILAAGLPKAMGANQFGNKADWGLSIPTYVIPSLGLAGAAAGALVGASGIGTALGLLLGVAGSGLMACSILTDPGLQPPSLSPETDKAVEAARADGENAAERFGKGLKTYYTEAFQEAYRDGAKPGRSLYETGKSFFTSFFE